jgi:hypothetical protein
MSKLQRIEPNPRRLSPESPLRAWNDRSETLVLPPSSTDILPTEQMLLLGQPFTRKEALERGLSRDVLARLVREGELRRMLTGVYIDSAAADTLTLRAAALARVAPKNCVVCDRTAAWLLGADVLGPESHNVIPPVDVFRLRGDNRLRRSGCRAGTRTLDRKLDLTNVNGLLTTNALRTALDLGRFLRRDDALAALDALSRVGGLTKADLTRQLPRFKGQRGVVQLRELVPLADPRAESASESVSRLRLIDGGLPTPEIQWEVRTPYGVVRFRLDMAYPDIKLAIEYDGREFHSSMAARARDDSRRAALRRAGWTFVILTRDDVYGYSPRAAAKVRETRDLLLRSA